MLEFCISKASHIIGGARPKTYWRIDRQTFIILLLLKRNTIILIAHDIYLPFIYAPSFRFMCGSHSQHLMPFFGLEYMAKLIAIFWFIIQINVIILNSQWKRKKTGPTTTETENANDWEKNKWQMSKYIKQTDMFGDVINSTDAIVHVTDTQCVPLCAQFC